MSTASTTVAANTSSSSANNSNTAGNNKSAAIVTGAALWSRVPKANAELFALTYGALVTEVLRDYGDDLQAANEQLDKMGHSMGVRCVDEYLAKLSTAAPPCQTFHETAEVIAKSALKMFLGVTAEVVHGTATDASSPSPGGGGDATTSSPYYSLILTDNPLAMFVELPDSYKNTSSSSDSTAGGDSAGKPQLEYNQLYCGLIRGALEMLNMRVECTFLRSQLRGDEVNEIKVQLKEVVAEGAGAEYQEE